MDSRSARRCLHTFKTRSAARPEIFPRRRARRHYQTVGPTVVSTPPAGKRPGRLNIHYIMHTIKQAGGERRLLRRRRRGADASRPRGTRAAFSIRPLGRLPSQSRARSAGANADFTRPPAPAYVRSGEIALARARLDPAAQVTMETVLFLGALARVRSPAERLIGF